MKPTIVRGCNENDKDALRWCIEKPDKRKSRKMSCRPFSELVYNEMGWDKSCRYKILGYRICFEGITLYVFDLLVPEIFHEGRKSSENGVGESKQTEAKAGTAKKASTRMISRVLLACQWNSMRWIRKSDRWTAM